MDQARSNVLQTAAFARRVVCRTLTVVGGVAAGTALAWWLSTASASADVRQPLPQADEQVRAAVTDVRDLTAPITAPVETTAGTLVEFVRESPPEDPLRDLGEKVKNAAETFRADAEQGLDALPGCDECVDDDAQRSLLADGPGRSDPPAAPVSAPVADVMAPVVDLDAIAHRTAKDRASADGMSRRGSPEPVLPSLPDVPGVPAPLPFSPAGVPVMGGHSSAGSYADAHLFAALPWQGSTSGLTRGGAVAVVDGATLGHTGAQPGVAPD